MSTLLIFLLLPTLLIDDIFIKSCTFLAITLLFGLVSFKKSPKIHDPRVLFVPLLGVYSTFYSMQKTLIPNLILPLDMAALNYALNLSVIFAFVFAFVVEIISKNSHVFNFEAEAIRTSDKLFLLSILCISLTLFVFIYTQGGQSKREIYSIYGSLQSFTLFFGTFLLIKMLAAKSIEILSIPTILIFFLSILSILIQGERDVMFRLALLLVILFFLNNGKFKISVYFMLIGTIVLIVPVSQFFKGILSYSSLSSFNIGLDLILSNEFISAGRNLYATVLYSSPGENSWFFVSDIVRGILPSAFIGFDIESATKWYNTEFRESYNFSGTSGWGFSFIAQGYIIGGIWGVILFAALLAFALIFLYNKSHKSLNFFVFYLFFLVAAIYAIRADLATVLSLGVKLPLMSMFIISLFRLFFPKVK
jgi:oligosaccharide repeat unit polymerase